MELSKSLRALAKELQTDFFGIADLTPAREFIKEQGGDIVSGYERAVTVGIALPDAIVDLLPRRLEEKAARALYKSHAYDIVNTRLDQTVSRLASLIGEAGFKALPVPASQTLDADKLLALASNKLAASLCGLGWIGRSCLLITPERGPRVRWATIFTDAPLEATGRQLKPRCGKCHACVDVCPAHAFTGRLFNPAEPREARYDVKACYNYISGLEKEKGLPIPICGMCLYVCPHGRKARDKGKRRNSGIV